MKTPNTALWSAIRGKGKTQRTISIRTCIPQPTLSRIITGTRQATAREREKLATCLELPESALFPEEVTQ